MKCAPFILYLQAKGMYSFYESMNINLKYCQLYGCALFLSVKLNIWKLDFISFCCFYVTLLVCCIRFDKWKQKT